MQDEYIGSFSFDQRLAPYDIRGSVAHVRMLARQKIIASADAQKIERGLLAILKDIQNGKQVPEAEDIHFAIENELVKRIGVVGKKMHTARSRNDQVALDLRLYTADFTQKIIGAIVSAQKEILKLAEKHQQTLMPGFTHLQHGQPLFFAHHLLAYGWMLERDKQRFVDGLTRVKKSPLGACALAGTAFDIDRQWVARELGFDAVGAVGATGAVTENSVDAVSDRDFIVEFVFCCALTMVHLSRMAEEWVIWSSSEFGYVRLSDEFTSGSSIMPQKRNPDTAELIRGKCSRTIGGLMHLLSLIKNQTLAYNRDLQEDKPPLFDSAETTLKSVDLAARIVASLQVDKKRMADSCNKGFLLSTELADYLARKGMPFREAHRIIHGLAQKMRAQKADDESLQKISLQELKKLSPIFENDVFKVLSLQNAAANRNSEGGTGTRALQDQIKKMRKILLAR